MKPIEAGCLAVVVSGCDQAVGSIVTVVRFVGALDGHDRVWEVDRALPANDSLGRFDGRMTKMATEQCLLRIDGYWETEDVEEEACA